MTDQSVNDFIHTLLTKENEEGFTVYLAPVPSTLKNHKSGRDFGNRIIYVVADIYPDNLNANTVPVPTEELRKWIDQIGYKCDELGVIIPVEFGGPAEYFNVYTQSKFMDTSKLDEDKKKVKEFLSANQEIRYVKMEFALDYVENAYKYDHPHYIYYRFAFYENGKVIETLSNMMINIIVWQDD